MILTAKRVATLQSKFSPRTVMSEEECAELLSLAYAELSRREDTARSAAEIERKAAQLTPAAVEARHIVLEDTWILLRADSDGNDSIFCCSLEGTYPLCRDTAEFFMRQLESHGWPVRDVDLSSFPSSEDPDSGGAP